MQDIQVLPEGTQAIPASFAADLMGKKLFERGGVFAFSSDDRLEGWRRLVIRYRHPSGARGVLQ